MSNCDVIFSTVSIAMIYVVRTVYRKHQPGETQHEEAPTVQCVAYRRRVKLQDEQPLGQQRSEQFSGRRQLSTSLEPAAWPSTWSHSFGRSTRSRA